MKNTFLILFCLLSLIGYSQNDGWNITASKKDNYTGIVVANGRIGILPSQKPFEVEHIILNNVYDKASPLGVSRTLQGMNFANLEIEVDGEKITEEFVYVIYVPETALLS